MPDNVTLDPPITNIERLLAKAAGMEGVGVDEPETRIERYLKAICDRLDNGGGSGGGGVLVVTDTDGTLDKTWQEIHDAMLVGGAVVRYSGDYYIGTIAAARYNNKNEEYTISANTDGSFELYSASSASGYPTLSE